MKKKVLAGLTLATLSALSANALNFGAGNTYDKYIACHRKNNSNAVQEATDEFKGKKLLPDKPVIKPAPVRERQMELKYGVPYPPIKPFDTNIIQSDDSK